MQAHSVSNQPRRSALSRLLGGFLASDSDPPQATQQPLDRGRSAAVPGGESDAGRLKRQYPIRIRLSLPVDGHGLAPIHAWLDDKCGPDGWAMAAVGAGRHHSLALYLLDPMLAGEFVARWCATDRVEAAEGVFRIRDAAPPIQLAGRRPKKGQPLAQLVPAAAA